MGIFLQLLKFGFIFLVTLMNTLGQEPSFIKDIDITSRLLAGITVPEEKDVTSSENWKKHEQLMTKAWSRYKKSNLRPMRSWSERNLSNPIEPNLLGTLSAALTFFMLCIYFQKQRILYCAVLSL